MATLNVNGQSRTVAAAPDTPLLWVLREEFGLTSAKYGCGTGQCGTCTVLLDGTAVPSCSVPVSSLSPSREIRTLEGFGTPLERRLQQAWVALNVSQCGYCQSGVLVAAAALLSRFPRPSDAQIDASIGNICRCGTYQRIRQAIVLAAQFEDKAAGA